METEMAGWLSVVFRLVHVVAAMMWIGNSLLFTWMELNLIPAPPKKDGEDHELLGHLDMLHGGGVFHLQKKIINPAAIPVPLHWFMWQSYTTWLSGVLLLISVFYVGGGSAMLDATKTTLAGSTAICLSVAGILVGWLIYDTLWKTGLKERKWVMVPLSFALILATAYGYNQVFNGRMVYLQIGLMMATCMSANVFFHIIQNQKKFMASLQAGRPHDLKYGKQAKLRSMHNHYMTFPVIFMMLSAHSPQVTSAGQNVPILGVIIATLAAIKFFMNSRYHFRYWLATAVAVFTLACLLISVLLAVPTRQEVMAATGVVAGAKRFVSLGCAACHQVGAAQIAPNLVGIYNTPQALADGSTILADEAYLRESILHPQLKVVKGYAAAMPSYAHLPANEIDELLAYIKSLTSTP
jgi:uncharacterized membrane protein